MSTRWMVLCDGDPAAATWATQEEAQRAARTYDLDCRYPHEVVQEGCRPGTVKGNR